MSEIDRAFNLARAKIGDLRAQYDRITGIEVSDAERELNESLENPVSTSSKTSSSAKVSETHFSKRTPEETQEQARKILGVAEGSSFAKIKKEYETLIVLCDPSKFEQGSEHAKKAKDLRHRVEWAYQTLSAKADSTERRFGTLEID